MGDDIAALMREQQAELRALSDAVRRLAAEPEPAAITVEQLARLYMKSVEFTAMAAAKTEAIRLRHLVRLLGCHRVMEVRLRIDWYREVRAGERGPRRRKPTAPATRNREVVRLLAACTWAVENKLIPSNPLAGIAMEPENNVRQTMPSPDDVHRVVFAARGRRLRAMLATAFGAGLRRSEACRLKLRQIDIDEGLIALSHQDTKTRRPRLTILTAWASRLVTDYLETRNIDSIYLFCTKSGRPVSGRNLLRDYQKAAKAAGIEAADGEVPWFHDLRSGFVGHQLELKTAERTIMDMGGWKTHAAFDRYVRVKREWILEAKRRVDAEERRPAQPSPGPMIATAKSAVGNKM